MIPERRREGRILALQALCQFDVQGDDFDKQLSEFLQDADIHQTDEIDSRSRPEVIAFARALTRGAWQDRRLYDERLNLVVKRWQVDRMALVDRNVLRLAIHELLEWPATPRLAVINEAVEVARAFGDADSPGFVNGVLDAIWKEIEKEMMPNAGLVANIDSVESETPGVSAAAGESGKSAAHAESIGSGDSAGSSASVESATAGESVAQGDG